MGADRVIFGSDWPHIEGLPEPLDYLTELQKFDDESVRRIMWANAASSTSCNRQVEAEGRGTLGPCLPG